MSWTLATLKSQKLLYCIKSLGNPLGLMYVSGESVCPWELIIDSFYSSDIGRDDKDIILLRSFHNFIFKLTAVRWSGTPHDFLSDPFSHIKKYAVQSRAFHS